MNTILVVDDEPNYLIVLSELLKDENFEVFTAENGKLALEIIKKSDLDLVITDMQMPVMNGMELLREIKNFNSELPVIMITAYGEIEKAVAAMQAGALNYLSKPFKNEELLVNVNKAIDHYTLIKENKRLRNEFQSRFGFANMVGKNKKMLQLYSMIEKVAPTPASVLITGESGTGKELVAKAIHFNCQRRKRPFISVNCAALPDNLLESELFGHEKGAFTGAIALRKGRFELADTGTLFLDEIGEMAMPLQAKFLRILQEQVFERVGGTKELQVDVRIIAATNKDLKQEVQDGKFREDLFYRLNVLNLHLPPLRERRDDIPLLINHFIKKYAKQLNNPSLDIKPEVVRLLSGQVWEGNVRELENIIERASILCNNNCIEIADAQPGNEENSPQSSFEINFDTENMEITDTSLPDMLGAIEKKMLRNALKKAENVQTRAAKILGITKSLLQYKMKKFGLHKKKQGT